MNFSSYKFLAIFWFKRLNRLWSYAIHLAILVGVSLQKQSQLPATRSH